MIAETQRQMAETIGTFHLPRYSEITNVGLFLEQVTRLVNSYLAPIGRPELTPSMVSNYVKQKTIPGPVKKTYGADSIAYLIMVALLKTVMSMEDIRLFRSMQERQCTVAEAYDFFCAEFEGLLQLVFGLKDRADEAPSGEPEAETLRVALLAVTHQIYLDKCLEKLHRSGGARMLL